MSKKRKYTKRKTWKSRKKYTPTKAQTNKLLLVKKLYDNYGSHQKVAEDLSVTRERVRQLLVKGDYYKLYKYEPKHEYNFRKIRETISKEVLTGVLKNETNRFKVCEILSISMGNLYKLIQFYNIDFEDYRQDFRQRKFLAKYSDIVNKLGHHPSTTELNSRPDWRNTWFGIDRIWGSIEDFRKEFGIERPPFNMHPNTLAAFKEGVLVRQKIKQNKINSVLEFMKSSDEPLNINKITKGVSLNKQMIRLYLIELRKKGLVRKIGSGIYTRYCLKQ